MKTFFVIMITGLVWATGIAWAGTVGDIDSDAKITLTEAMGALQVSAGRRVAAYTPDDSYDMSDYAPEQTSGKRIWKQTEYGSNSANISIGIIGYSQETLNGQQVIAKKYEAGQWAEYGGIEYFIGNKWLGEIFSGVYSFCDPPVTTMINPWATGQKIINHYVYKSDSYFRLEYREYELLGEEDVTVPAGTFENCLKILQKRVFYGRTHINYLAKGIGIVKTMRIDNTGNGYIWELMDVQKEDGTYLFDSNVCQMSGTWIVNAPAQCSPFDSNCKGSGAFAMAYINGDTNSGVLKLSDFTSWNSSMRSINMHSDDGINFSPDPDASWPDTNYDGQPDLPGISLKIENNAVTGTLNLNTGPIFTFNGAVVCQ
ncbi:MAG: hypothetical protein ABIJ59_19605 [Pseudomonadota bacterium]